jgi:hypothetical protein
MNTEWKLSCNYTLTDRYGVTFSKTWIFKYDAVTIFETFSKVIAKIIAEISDASEVRL